MFGTDPSTDYTAATMIGGVTLKDCPQLVLSRLFGAISEYVAQCQLPGGEDRAHLRSSNQESKGTARLHGECTRLKELYHAFR